MSNTFRKPRRLSPRIAASSVAAGSLLVGAFGVGMSHRAAAVPQQAAPQQDATAATAAPASDPLARASIVAVMKRAYEFQIAEQAKTKPKNDWIRSAFYTGVMAAGKATGDPAYKTQALEWSKGFNFSPRPITTRHADNQACVQTYTELFFDDKNPEYIAPAIVNFDAQVAENKPGRVTWWWCDALFMAPPAFTRLAVATGDKKYLTYMHEAFWDSTEFLYDKEEKLYFRDKNFFDKKTANGKKVFWSRGNGWVLAGLARVLQYLPPDDAERPRYIVLYRDMSAKIASLQGEDGLWRPSLLDPEQFPSPETSGTAFYTFAMAWGVNSGILEREKYLPVVRKGWAGLVGKVDAAGKLGYVQGVAAAPGRVVPEATQEYAVGAFLLAGVEMMKLSAPAVPVKTGHFDFGSEAAPGYAPISETTPYDPAKGYGWVGAMPKLELRNRQMPDALKRDYIFGREGAATFRVKVPSPGLYRLTLVSGDTDYGDHVLQTTIKGSTVKLPLLRPQRAEFVTLTATIPVKTPTVDFTFSSPINNWVLNALTLVPVTKTEKTAISSERYRAEYRSAWGKVIGSPDPTAPLFRRFNQGVEVDYPDSVLNMKQTGLTRADYLKVIAGNVNFWRKHQDKNGAIVDPYRKVEFQYSTPAYAHAAALLAAQAGRKDLVESAAKAMDWSVRTLSQRKAASAHEDFYPPMLAHAYPLLKPLVTPARAKMWETQIKGFNPYGTYRTQPGSNNWNLVALSGESRFHQLGLRPTLDFVEDSLAGQGKHFDSPWGLYLEGPMAYDHFPRLWGADMIAHDFSGKYAPELRETLRRGAITSMFMQSPWGELPAGGRSAQHQWNEAEQCVTYEIYAAQAAKAGDTRLAAFFKRAAHLSLASMKRWVRPSGEMQIVKNWVDPAKGFAFEGYSAHSQYNLLPMSMLAIAYENAATTENLQEMPAPADVGGFVFAIDPKLHKIIANAGGMYVEIDTNADHHYDALGLIRVHSRKMDPQIGPGDSLTAGATYRVPKEPRTTSGVGVSWLGKDGKTWHRLGEQSGVKTTLTVAEETATRVAFSVQYDSTTLDGPTAIVENYVLTPDSVELTTSTPGYTGALRYTFPVLADNGKTKTKIALADGAVSVTLNNTTQTFTPVGAAVIRVDPTLYPNHNGYARLGIGEYPAGASSITLRLAPK